MSAADFAHHDDMRPLESAGMPTAPRGLQPVRHALPDLPNLTREELREIVARRLEQRARVVLGDDRWTELQRGVVGHSIDPWSAADEMLGPVGA